VLENMHKKKEPQNLYVRMIDTILKTSPNKGLVA